MSRKKYESDVNSINRESEFSSIVTNIICELCNDSLDSKFIILNCGHIFHVKCLVSLHLKDIYDYPSIDEQYFTDKKCLVCNSGIETEDFMVLHTKFLSSTNHNIVDFTKKLEKMEGDLNKIKQDIKVCLDYKHKLQQNREKSKQIIAILNAITI